MIRVADIVLRCFQKDAGQHRDRRADTLSEVNHASWQANVPLTYQSESDGSGAACLCIVAEGYGKRLSLTKVRELIARPCQNAGPAELLAAAEVLGFRGTTVQVEVGSLHKLSPPAILTLGEGRYVVMTKSNRRRGTIIDPVTGRRSVRLGEVQSQATGPALILRPVVGFRGDEKRGLRSRLRRYIGHLAGTWHSVSAILTLTFVLRALALTVPALTAIIVDRVIPRQDYSALQLVAATMVGVVVVNGAGNLCRTLLLINMRTVLDERMMVDFLGHLVRVPFAFFQERSTGDLMMRFSSNATVREVLSQQALAHVPDIVFLLSYLALMVVYKWPLALVVVGLGLAQCVMAALSFRIVHNLNRREIQAQIACQSYLIETMRGMEVIKIAAAEDRVLKRWHQLFQKQLKASVDRGRKSAILGSLTSAINTVSPVALLIAGTILVLKGDLTLGRMLGFNVLAASFLAPLSSVVASSQSVEVMGIHLDRIEEVFNVAPERTLMADPEKSLDFREIELQNVSFRYSEQGPNVLSNISFRIEGNSFVAIVGTTGCGKSTIAKLILGLYTPSEGYILYDGVRHSEICLPNLRAHVGAVPQGSFLFNSSIRENIAFNNPGLSIEDIRWAAQTAGISHEIERLPMGYDTLISELGANLSGGQRQRLCIARALANRPKLLLFDEATSEVDGKTEAAIFDNISRLNCTRIVIAHRLNTIVAADLILVVSNGCVIESGTHDHLLSIHGHYADLFSYQEASSRLEPAHK